MMAERTVRHLWDCAAALKSESHATMLLKSFYRNTCNAIAKKQLQLPKEKFAVSQMCPRCASFWSESKFKLKLSPQRLATSTRANRLIARLETASSTQSKQTLSKKQRQRAKWLKKRSTSSVEVHCGNCQQKTSVPLQKPPKSSAVNNLTELESSSSVVSITDSTTTIKKRKRKNKAGLKLITPSKIVEDERLHTAPLKKRVAVTTVHKATAVTSTKKTAKSTTATPTKISSIAAQTPLTAKAKKKIKKKATLNSPVTPKVQSKTQQQNSILQLASLLRAQSTAASKAKQNTTQNRLQSLLK